MRKCLFLVEQFFLSVVRFFSFIVNGFSFCVVCGCSTYSFFPVCDKCNKKHFTVESIFNEKICSICGRVLISEKKVCTQCRNEVVFKNTFSVLPLFSYRLWNAELLCRWKLNGERTLSLFFAEKIATRLFELKKTYGDFSIVPVPPRANKIKDVGWDQVQELSEFLEYKYNFKVLRVLERVSQIQQKKLDKEQRLNTVGKSYSLKENVAELPEIVCLVDDVITTGSTIESCARALKKGGVKKIMAVSLFTVDC